MLNENELEQNLNKCLEIFDKKINLIYSGKVSPTFLNNIYINNYGALTPLFHVASISNVSSYELVVRPFEIKNVRPIFLAIEKANLDATIKDNKNSIHVILAQMTEEKRKKAVTELHKITEQIRIMFRNTRQKFLSKIKNNSDISENEKLIYQEKIDTIITKFNKILKDRCNKKETNIMKI